MNEVAVVVRLSRPSDAAALSAIALSIITAYGLAPEPELIAYGRKAQHLTRELVAELGSEIAGTITLSRHPHDRKAGWISKFFVDPLARGGGVGRVLLDTVIAEAEELGMEWLELSTLKVFHAAIHLYETTGWQRRALPERGMERRYFKRITPR
ncbi:MAG: GNAT family N-acetyltransferase [Polyangiales bacterium]